MFVELNLCDVRDLVGGYFEEGNTPGTVSWKDASVCVSTTEWRRTAVGKADDFPSRLEQGMCAQAEGFLTKCGLVPI